MIDMLPDDVLLEIFDFYREDPAFHTLIGSIYTWRWQALIQVRRRWRCVIFGSPLRLDLQIVCTDRTPTRTSLDIWPHFLNTSIPTAFHSRRSPDLSGPLLTSTIFAFSISRIPGTFHPMRWSLTSLRCPISNFFALDSDPLYLALPKPHRLLAPAWYSLLLLTFPSVELASTLKTLSL